MLKDRLRELRLKKGLTQEKVGRELFVTAQTVSKWERGLVSPDIALLPRIALLFECSLDSLFEMEEQQKAHRQADFEERIRRLKEKKDLNGVFEAYAQEIHRRPEAYSLYVEWMRFAHRNQLVSDPHLFRVLAVTEYAFSHLRDPDQRNEIFKWLLTLCAKSSDPMIRKKRNELYEMIPSIRHSREIFAGLVLEKKEAELQIRKNTVRCVDMAECALRQLAREKTSAEEKLYYDQKALELYEVLLKDGFGGFWDPPYVVDCAIVASLLAEEARIYMEKIFVVLERHLRPEDCVLPPVLQGTAPENGIPFEKKCKDILLKLVRDPRLAAFHSEILDLAKRYYRHFGFDPACLTKGEALI